MVTRYLTVSTWQLNWLKVKPYGTDNLMTQMYDSLTAFQVKGKGFEKQTKI
jgi:hypothetical protein